MPGLLFNYPRLKPRVIGNLVLLRRTASFKRFVYTSYKIAGSRRSLLLVP